MKNGSVWPLVLVTVGAMLLGRFAASSTASAAAPSCGSSQEEIRALQDIAHDLEKINDTLRSGFRNQ